MSNDHKFMVFQVSATGYGIPVDEQLHLFDPFFRAANVKSIEGTGPGLSIVKTYVERHQGTITVQSKEGSGTTLVVRLAITSPE